MKVVDLVKDGNQVWFDSYRQGVFYYGLLFNGDIYNFPVELEDIGSATLNRVDKAITFMRWIRKALESGTFICVKKNAKV